MAQRLLMDEFHVTFLALRNLTAAEFDAIRRTLNEARFRSTLRRAVRRVAGRFPALGKVRVRLSR